MSGNYTYLSKIDHPSELKKLKLETEAMRTPNESEFKRPACGQHVLANEGWGSMRRRLDRLKSRIRENK